MPLQAGLVTVPPVDTTPPPPPTPPAAVEVGRPRATWFAPDGSAWLLDVADLGYFTTRDVDGINSAAPISLVTDPHPRGGVRVRHIRPEARPITWPMHIRGDTHMEFLQRWRDLANAFTQTRRYRAPGTLRISRPDGSARDIDAYYQDGFKGEPGYGRVSDLVVLTLLAEDPYWRDAAVITEQRQYLASTTPFLAPYPTVSTSNVLGTTTIENPSNVEVWPEWTITGPATEVVATNVTTGEAFTLTGTLTAGQTVTITTDPPSVTGPSDANWLGLLDWPSAVLWGLTPGVNEVQFTVTGAAAGTLISLSFARRYETA